MSEDVWLNDAILHLASLTDKGRSPHILLLGRFPSRFIRQCQSVSSTEIERSPQHYCPQRIDDRLGLPGDIDHPDGMFDAVFARDWSEQSPWMDWTFREIRRVLIPSGTAFVQLQLNTTARTRGTLQSLLKKVWGFIRKTTRLLGFREVGNLLVTQNSAINTVEQLKLILSRIQVDYELNCGPMHFPNWVLRMGGIGSRQRCELTLKAARFAKCSSENLDPSDLMVVAEHEFAEQIEELASSDLPIMPSVRLHHSSLPKRALILSPHPDDELIGAGGTIIQIVKNGGKCKVVQMTNGRSAVALDGQTEELRKSIRVQEAKKVATQLGVELACWEDSDDAVLESRPELVSRLRGILSEFQPDAVFLPFICDAHPDHVASNVIFCDAHDERIHDSVEAIFAYEVWSLCPSNSSVDVTAHAQAKRELLSIYRTAMRPVDYSWRWELVSAFHMQKHFQSQGHLEVFRTDSPGGYKELVNRLSTRRPQQSNE